LISKRFLGSAVVYHPFPVPIDQPDDATTLQRQSTTDDANTNDRSYDNPTTLHKRRIMVEASKTSSAYDTLIGVRNKITRLNGIITPKNVDRLEDELGGVCTIIKTHHYTQGQKYGHLASIIPQDKYRIVISDEAWIRTAPVDPGAYSAAALGVGNAAAQRDN
jgi:hypothetical protein